MNILDENIPKPQRLLLESWGVRVRQIGVDVGSAGMQDDEIIPFLLKQRRPTFFTRDDDFYGQRLCHGRYCLVYLAVDKYEVASFVRRLLKHSAFNSQSKRMGKILRLSSAGIAYWQRNVPQQEHVAWA